MEIEIIREDSEGFEIKILGEGHTFLSLLNSFLGKNKKVEYSAYKIEHPLIGEPALFFKTKGSKKIENVPISKVKGIGPKTVDQMKAAGIKTADQLLHTTPENLSERTGIAEKLILKYVEAAKKMVPADRFGYKAVLKESLKEMSKTFESLKKEFAEAK